MRQRLDNIFMIHKRELSDSMGESGSSLLYLLQYYPVHDRLNIFLNISVPPMTFLFSLEHLTRIASDILYVPLCFPLPQHIPHGLHLKAGLPSLIACIFASAHPARIASDHPVPVHHRLGLCLSTSRTDCIGKITQMQCYKTTQHAVSW